MMHQAESELLDKYHRQSDYISPKDIEAFISQPLGKSTQMFLEEIRSKDVFKFDDGGELWLEIETYLQPDQKEDVEAKTLTKIETLLKKNLEKKESGTYLMIFPSGLIKQVYLSGNAVLIDLVKTYLPIPPARLFDEGDVPEWIKAREQTAYNTIEAAIHKVGPEAIKKHEQAFIKVQRHVRNRIRLQQEIQRITQHHKSELKALMMTAEQLIQDANVPYRPKCDAALATRIMNAAKQVSAFSTIKHITSNNTLQSVLDDALYGRKTLLDYYMTFNPAALKECDILNGDANVVCLGPQDIDPSACGAIVIEFDLPALIKTKPSAFYKQRDLEYNLRRKRGIMLGGREFFFDHSGDVRGQMRTETSLQIKSPYSDEMLYASKLTKSTFIAYNIEQIHSILTLNFFRFLDTMRHPDGSRAYSYANTFYQRVSVLSDEQLVEFLTDLEKKMTDTAEFNFYGTHQINFSTITSISNRYEKYTLHLQVFIEKLNQGDLNALRLAKQKLPVVFQSYRFLDYLLTNVKHPEIRYYLDDARQRCKTPEWIHYTPLETIGGKPIQWELEQIAAVDLGVSLMENIVKQEKSKEQLTDMDSTDEGIDLKISPAPKS